MPSPSSWTDPYVKDKVAEVMAGSGFDADSHSGKDLLGILESYPRDEVFQASTGQLLDVATQVVHLREKRRCRLFCRLDDFGRFVSALVFIPRDRYNTAVRLRMERSSAEAFGATSVDFTTRVSESALAQVHFVFVSVPGATGWTSTRSPSKPRSPTRPAPGTRTCSKRPAEVGEEETARLAGLYGRAFPTAYKEDFTVKQGRGRPAPPRRLESSHRARALQAAVQPRDERRFKLFRRDPLSLTQVLPLFTHMGVEVVDERPYALTRRDGQAQYVYDFGLRVGRSALVLDEPRRLRELFEGAVAAVWEGRAESDGFNALVSCRRG
jgi:glutamate dehydrogenase